jgi:hypothetical protein
MAAHIRVHRKRCVDIPLQNSVAVGSKSQRQRAGAAQVRDVAVIDIPNAFIQTRIEDEKDMATIKLRGVLVISPLDGRRTVLLELIL